MFRTCCATTLRTSMEVNSSKLRSWPSAMRHLKHPPHGEITCSAAPHGTAFVDSLTVLQCDTAVPPPALTGWEGGKTFPLLTVVEGLEPKWFTTWVTISLSPPFLILAGLGFLDSPLMNTELLATNEQACPKMPNHNNTSPLPVELYYCRKASQEEKGQGQTYNM